MTTERVHPVVTQYDIHRGIVALLMKARYGDQVLEKNDSWLRFRMEKYRTVGVSCCISSEEAVVPDSTICIFLTGQLCTCSLI